MRFDALNKLWERVKETSHDFRVSVQVFPDLDVDRVARDLRLEHLGKEQGAAEEPPSDATSHGETELAVVERIEAETKAANQTLEDQFQIFSERLTNLDFEGQFGLIRQANLTTVTDFVAVCQSGLNELHGLRRALADAENERDSFRQRHHLTRAARVQSAGKWWITVLFLIVCILAETIFNDVFLSAGSEQGIVGGTTIAIGFAILNIGVAFVAAHLIKLTLHRSFFVKMVGVVSALAYLAIAGTINLALAHYRETSEVLFGEAGREVVSRMLTAPFSLSDVHSCILFGIGIV